MRPRKHQVDGRPSSARFWVWGTQGWGRRGQFRKSGEGKRNKIKGLDSSHGVLGTHISLLQTGGWKEARFSSTHDLTLTRRSMAGRQESSAHNVSPANLSAGEVLSAEPPVGHLMT